jgi:lipopolysaccharide/colanic/teichoic acid biosynthesis glycosyltransferase
MAQLQIQHSRRGRRPLGVHSCLMDADQSPAGCLSKTARPKDRLGGAIAVLAVLWLGLLVTVVAETTQVQSGQVLPTLLGLGAVFAPLWAAWPAISSLFDSRKRAPWRVPRPLAPALLAVGIAAPALALLVGLLSVVVPAARAPLAVAGGLMVLLASGAARSRLGYMPSVVVVGDAAFREHAHAIAEASARQIVACGEPAPETFTIAMVERLVHGGNAPIDELLVQADRFERIYQISQNLRPQGSRVIVLDQPGKAPAAAPVSAKEWRSPFDNPIPPAGRALKRCADLILTPLLLLATAPVMLVVALAIVLDSRSGPLFRQERVGLDGRTFTLYKFRTMRRNNCDAEHRQYVAALIRGEAPPNGRVHKLTGDNRITRVGRVLRHFSIDELPQLWNVLRGDMTLVGPRPPLPHETEMYDLYSWRRLRVKPGLTGLWQVSGRCELTFSQMVALDIQYWQTWGPLSDLGIILRTPRAIISGRGAA